MLHIITVHHRDPRWIDVQLRQFARHLNRDYTTWASLEGISEQHNDKFDVVLPSCGRHAGKLNFLASEVAASQDRDDLIMFIDGDAFLISDPEPLCAEVEGSKALVAVQRIENLGDTQPHPSFSLTRVGDWLSLPGDWSAGYPWINDAGETISDVGGNMLRAVERARAHWRPLLRSNGRNLHPIWFGIYGDVVYHHGAGFRNAVSRLDVDAMRVPSQWRNSSRIKKAIYRAEHELCAHRGGKQSGAMFDLINAFPDAAMDFLRGEDYMLEDAAIRSGIARVAR